MNYLKVNGQTKVSQSQPTKLGGLFGLEQSEATNIAVALIITPSKAKDANSYAHLNNKYLTNKQGIDFGRVQRQRVTQQITIYKNRSAYLGVADLVGIDLPLTASPSTVELQNNQYREITLAFNPEGAPSIVNDLKTIGAIFRVKALAGLFLKAIETAQISKSYIFKTVLEDALDGTEERTPLLETAKIEYRYDIEVASADLTQALNFIRTLNNNSIMLPDDSDSFIVNILNGTTLTTSDELNAGESIMIDKAGVLYPEIAHITASTGNTCTYVKDTTSADLTIEAGHAIRLKAFQVLSIEGIENGGTTCTISLKVAEV